MTMENAITSLTTSVNASSLWGAFAGVVPVLAVIVPVSLGLYFTRKLIKGAGNKGKTKI